MHLTARAGGWLFLVALASGVPACVFDNSGSTYQGGGRKGEGTKPPDNDNPTPTSTATTTSSAPPDGGIDTGVAVQDTGAPGS